MKPSIPKGTRDFSAGVVRKRNYIFNTIRTVFELYGFQPLETPAMENLETLMGKYGDEGDKLIFRILDSGNPFSKEFFVQSFSAQQNFEIFKNAFIELFKAMQKSYNDDNNFKREELWKAGIANPNPQITDILKLNPEIFASDVEKLLTDKEYRNYYLPKLKNEISEKALRYDLTIPFARYVAMNHGQLTFPFRRYQIQPVWRADNPQRGRYREFYQCDADVVGSNSLLNEIELANIYTTVFEKLGIDVEIKINSRKILSALAEICGGTDKMTDITTAIDKLDKIGIEKVKEELRKKNLDSNQIGMIEKYLLIDGSNNEKINAAKELFGGNETAQKGIEEIEFILNYKPQTINHKLQIDFTLARGLNYYTGIIFEIKAKNVQMGSIGGGGRYDDLTGLFGVPNIPGVGISFGVDRIYDVMEELKLFPEEVQTRTQVLFFNLGEEESKTAFGLMQQLRNKNISCELYHENTKFDKQFKYAEKKNISYAIFIGSKELAEKSCTIKNLQTGGQTTIQQSFITQFNF